MHAIENMKTVDSSIDVRLLLLDLQSMASVKEDAEQFMREEPKLDILIHNAGVGASDICHVNLSHMFADNGYSISVNQGWL